MIDWKKIKLLIVDMDNCLCDTFHTLSKPQWEHVERSLIEKGWGEYAELLKKNFGKHGFKYVLERSGMTDEQVKFAIQVYDDVDVSPLQLFPDAQAILGCHMPKILITRGEPSLQKQKIAHLDLRKHFDEIIIIDTFHTKTETIAEIMQKRDLAPQEGLIIGDRIEEEISDGKKLGIPAVLVRRPDWPVAKANFEPDFIVDNLEIIVNKLKNHGHT